MEEINNETLDNINEDITQNQNIDNDTTYE